MFFFFKDDIFDDDLFNTPAATVGLKEKKIVAKNDNFDIFNDPLDVLGKK
jgi:hypothetical protein